jgi:putative nucleotidyltransferase with HDIG domain
MAKRKYAVWESLDSSSLVKWVLLFAISAMFSVMLYPNLVIKRHIYQFGDIAKKDIKARIDFFVEGKDATEAGRKKAAEEVLTVYDFDTSLAEKMTTNVREAFALVRSAVIAENRPRPNNNLGNRPTSVDLDMEKKPSAKEIIWQKKSEFEDKIGISVSEGAYTILEKENFSIQVENIIIQIITKILDQGVVANKELLLREMDKGITLRTIGTNEEQVVHNLKLFQGLDQAKTMVRIVGTLPLKELNYTLRNLIVDFVQELIQPNITLNRNATEERKQKAAAEVKPFLYKIKAGEMLLREGERVTKLSLLKLNALQNQIKDRRLLENSAGAALVMTCFLLIVYFVYSEQRQCIALSSNKNLLFLATVIISFFIIFKVSLSFIHAIAHSTSLSIPESSMLFGIPLASAAMIVCLFMGFDLAVPVALITAFSAAVLYENSLEMFIYYFSNNVMGAYWIRCCRERKIFIIAGLKLGILNLFLTTAVCIYMPDCSYAKLLWDLSSGFLGGITAGILTAGVVPLLEVAFGYKSDISLLELANLERPILKQLMLEAPGTYYHSMVVGALAEAAAQEIDANPLLAKVCGYYHDIGKMKKPLYFIENQRNGRNRHDKLAPSMSSLILIAHLKEGVEIAQKHKLGQIIIDAIRQHHGKSTIEFFYDKAKRLKGDDTVKIEDFRYPGPKPQTREIALIMLADVVEAASRTLENPTPSRIQGNVQRLINKIFTDGQLDNCELTLKDLHLIAKSFNQTLNGILHHRIEYPEKREANRGKGKNVRPDNQQTKKTQDISQKDPESSTGHIRRLGQS